MWFDGCPVSQTAGGGGRGDDAGTRGRIGAYFVLGRFGPCSHAATSLDPATPPPGTAPFPPGLSPHSRPRRRRRPRQLLMENLGSRLISCASGLYEGGSVSRDPGAVGLETCPEQRSEFVRCLGLRSTPVPDLSKPHLRLCQGLIAGRKGPAIEVV